MKKIIALAFFALFGTSAFAQYTYIETGANGNITCQGQYNQDPGVTANDSKQQIMQKMSAVYKIGVWKYWHDNGQLAAEEHYDMNGNRIGIWKGWYPDGKVANEINFTTGAAVYYHPNGQKAEEGYMDATMMRIGAWKGWHANGQLNYSGEYKNDGSKKGQWLFYNESGISLGTENY